MFTRLGRGCGAGYSGRGLSTSALSKLARVECRGGGFGGVASGIVEMEGEVEEDDAEEDVAEHSEEVVSSDVDVGVVGASGSSTSSQSSSTV